MSWTPPAHREVVCQADMTVRSSSSAGASCDHIDGRPHRGDQLAVLCSITSLCGCRAARNSNVRAWLNSRSRQGALTCRQCSSVHQPAPGTTSLQRARRHASRPRSRVNVPDRRRADVAKPRTGLSRPDGTATNALAADGSRPSTAPLRCAGHPLPGPSRATSGTSLAGIGAQRRRMIRARGAQMSIEGHGFDGGRGRLPLQPNSFAIDHRQLRADLVEIFLDSIQPARQ